MEEITLVPAMAPSGEAIVFEFGCRLDPDSIPAVSNQISMARRLYNDLVAIARTAVEDAQAYILERAGPGAANVQAEIDALTKEFDAAKALDDEPEMKRIAQLRREKWKALGDTLKSVRKKFRAEVQQLFLSRIGRNASCLTYQARSKAVAEGLGWGTAGAMLDAALTAFKKSFVKGKAPRFASGQAIEQDCLTLQFTDAGGVSADAILSGKQGDFAIFPSTGCGKRKYGEFRFRLGAAKAGINASGTWQYHRPIPDGACIALARLVRRRVGPHFKWSIQLLVKPRVPMKDSSIEAFRKPLVNVHFGWSADTDGRRVAGIADSADPGSARILSLPPEIEDLLERSSTTQAERDTARDVIAIKVREIDVPDAAPEDLRELCGKIRRTRPQDISANRLHYLCRLLRDDSRLPDWLEAWRKEDRIKWQAQTGLARRARNIRKTFYRQTAILLARQYEAIAMEPLDLAEAALIVNEVTGEKTEFSRRARSGRVVAAIYELESSIRWAASKTETAILEMIGPTARQCGFCGGAVVASADNLQEFTCLDCGAILDRKQNGAAVAWQMAFDRREPAVAAYWFEFFDTARKKAEEKTAKQAKLVDGRRKARNSAEVVREVE